MNLYLDIGNSRLKWIAAGDDAPHVAQSLEALTLQWQALSEGRSIERIIACNVRGEKFAKQVEHIAQSCFALGVAWQYSSAAAYGVVNAYATPRDLGADRWAALIAGRALYPETNCIIVDAGTAITVDLLDKTGQHQGGVIMPGIRLMLDALNTAEQLSPDLNAQDRQAQALARTTRDAILSGVYYSVSGGITAVIEQQARLINVKIDEIPIIMTGGDADMLQLTPLQTVSRPRLVLDGLAILAQGVQ